MLRKLCSYLTIAGFMFLLSIPAFAHGGGDRAPRARNRQHLQQKRIVQGVRSGELTRGELRRLGREQHSIRHERREAWADGELSRSERRDIFREQNQASRHIYRAKHNRRDRN